MSGKYHPMTANEAGGCNCGDEHTLDANGQLQVVLPTPSKTDDKWCKCEGWEPLCLCKPPERKTLMPGQTDPSATTEDENAAAPDAPYSTRIPAAIARAKAWQDSPPPTRVLFGSGPYGEADTRAADDKHLIGRFEDENEARISILGPDAIALADALWEENDQHLMGLAEFVGCKGCKALIAFTEKIESLP